MKQEVDTVPVLNARLVQIRLALELNQEAFAELIGMSRAHLSNIERGRRDVPFEVVTFLVEAKGVSAHWFHTGSGTMFASQQQQQGKVNGHVNGQVSGKDKMNHVSNQVQEQSQNTYQPTRTEIIVATQDTTGNPTYTVVGHKAAANYLGGYQSQEYYESLGVVTLPRALVGSKKQGIFLQIEGDSMTPKFQHGDWVACTLLDRSEWSQVRDLDCYVVVSSTYGIQFKRVKNTMAKYGFLRCKSDNRRHRAYNIEEENILQLFRFVLHVSPDASNPEDALYQKVDHLEDTTTDLRELFEQMQSRIQDLEEVHPGNLSRHLKDPKKPTK